MKFYPIQKYLGQLSLGILLMIGWSISSFATVPLESTAPPPPRDAMEYFFNQSFNNLPEEVEMAREEGKIGILVMFNDPDCPWCKKMKATVLNQVPVQEFFRKHFRLLHIDTKGDTMMTNFNGDEIAEKDFALKVHRVRATPVFMFFDLDGNVMLRYTGATRSIDEFMWMGEFVLNGDYKTTKFARYKQEKLGQSKQ